MLDTNELRGLIAKKGMSQRKMAARLDITEKTFYVKMREGVFRTDELEKMAEILGIRVENIGTLFCDNRHDVESEVS